MGLDVYAGPICRYVGGGWETLVQQAARQQGIRAEVVRPDQPEDVVTDPDVIARAVAEWQRGLLQSLDVSEGWPESADLPYMTDKPDWDGYGAVVLLAAYDEQPQLAPGAKVRKGLRTRSIEAVDPRRFPEADAFKMAAQSATRYPTLLLGVEWCLPITAGPTVFKAPTPNGHQLAMGRVDRLLEELTLLNSRTVQLSPSELGEARQSGPPRPGAPVEEVAPFGLSVLLTLAEFAMTNKTPWIMDH